MVDEEKIPVVGEFWGIQVRITDEKGTVTDPDCWPLAVDRGLIEDTVDEDDGTGVCVYLGDEQQQNAYLFTLKSDDEAGDGDGETVLFLGFPNLESARMVAAGQYDPDEVEEIRELDRFAVQDILRNSFPSEPTTEPASDLPDLVPSASDED